MIPFPDRENSLTTRAIVRTRVLVVDDEPLIRWSLCTALAAAGFDAVAAADAPAAARLASEWPPPRVVLVDLENPDVDGKELLTGIRAVYPDCRFLIMTTDPRPGNGYCVDGVDVVEKPFDIARIVDRVSTLAAEPPRRESPLWLVKR